MHFIRHFIVLLMDLLKERNKVMQFSQQTVLSHNCVTLNWKQTIHTQGPWLLSYAADESFYTYRIYMALKSIIINSPELK